jgi:DNA-binding XRE family transcriptional regulator
MAKVLVSPEVQRQIDRLPPLPATDAKGNRPALEYIQVSIARDIIKERRFLGLSQLQLAQLAGLRQETLSRLESGKHSPTVAGTSSPRSLPRMRIQMSSG